MKLWLTILPAFFVCAEDSHCTTPTCNVSQESGEASLSGFREEEFWTEDLIEVFQTEYIDELPDIFVAEAEAEEQLRQGVESMSMSNPTSQAKRSQKKTPLVKCHVCPGKSFNSLEKYLQHRVGHAMTGENKN